MNQIYSHGVTEINICMQLINVLLLLVVDNKEGLQCISAKIYTKELAIQLSLMKMNVCQKKKISDVKVLKYGL